MNDFLKLEYPYYSYSYKWNKAKIKKIVSAFQPHIITESFMNAKPYQDSYFIIIDKWSDNLELNSITDYFTEKVRVKCSFATFESPYDYWQKNKEKIVYYLQEKKKKITIHSLREELFWKTKLCSNFRISVILPILKHFDCKRYLDISAGWGDRLLASVFHGVDFYFAVDPNKDLHPYYQKIIKTFVKKEDHKKFVIQDCGFEEVTLPKQKFDLVFSSPPFFDLEKYSQYNNNSLTKYKTEEEWSTHFFMKSIMKAYHALIPGGHMILYIHGSPYVNKKIESLHKKMKYKGLIYFFDTKLRGMHVWQK